MFSDEEIQKLAKLSRLEIQAGEMDFYKKGLEDLLGYIDNIKSLDLSDVKPMVGVEDHSSKMRPDEIGVSISKDKSFANAPEVEQNHFAIPKVMGGN